MNGNESCIKDGNLSIFKPSHCGVLRQDDWAYVIHNNMVRKSASSLSRLRPVSVSGDGNCLYRSISVLLVGDKTLASILRILTSLDIQCSNYLLTIFLCNVYRMLVVTCTQRRSQENRP
ncbi:uncharacterized protein LOC130614699 [Hydractinia symbiolongicarpus]|uniref:uncharacterized protein LOC130614699 n=1 Tax=Hydractinia symbiolongicarpus TaxID=13093 RepID=UPI00254B2E26|nr:uncharacterized protein LOC130614699 [Hydractinia symbiolongicarpus]